jgi:polar amino acid transport system substrate-binding protein
MPRTTTARRYAAILGGLTTVALLAACSATSAPGSSSSTDAAPSTPSTDSQNPLVDVTIPQKVDAIAALVPAELRSKKEVVVGVDPSLPPKEFLAEDGKTLQGVDIDLVYAVGNVLGLTMKFDSAAFDTLIPGVQNGRYDLVNSSMSPTLERQKILDFVTTDTSGEQLLVKKENASTYTSLDDLCGTEAGAIRGSLQVDDLTAQSAVCTDAGKKEITVSVFPNANDLNLALMSGRVVASFLDVPVAGYQATQSKGKLQTVGKIYRAGYEGMAMPKGSGLAEAVAAAMNNLVETGVYEEIFTKWNLPDSMLDTLVVNPQDQS